MDFHLAQLNIARMKAPLEDLVMQEFVDNLDYINGIAEKSPGYIWRLQGEDGDATSIRVFDDTMLLVNYSIWESIESLQSFVYDSEHTQFLKRKKQWFDRMDNVYMVMWWIPAGEVPELEEAKARLAYLQENGESIYAFSFRRQFEPDGSALNLPE